MGVWCWWVGKVVFGAMWEGEVVVWCCMLLHACTLCLVFSFIKNHFRLRKEMTRSINVMPSFWTAILTLNYTQMGKEIGTCTARGA